MAILSRSPQKRIFEQFRLPGFTTLIRSKETLKLFLARRNLLDKEVSAEVKDVKIQKSGVDAKLSFKIKNIAIKGDKEIFNPLHSLLVKLLQKENYDHNSYVNNDIRNFDKHNEEIKSNFQNKEEKEPKECEEKEMILRFFSGKGPPMAI